MHGVPCQIHMHLLLENGYRSENSRSIGTSFVRSNMTLLQLLTFKVFVRFLRLRKKWNHWYSRHIWDWAQSKIGWSLLIVRWSVEIIIIISEIYYNIQFIDSNDIMFVPSTIYRNGPLIDWVSECESLIKSEWLTKWLTKSKWVSVCVWERDGSVRSIIFVGKSQPLQ